DEMAALHDLPGGNACAVNQVLYHLGSRGIEHSLRPWQREHGIPLMGYCPLAQGGRLGDNLLSHPEVCAVAAAHGLSAAQVLLAWAIRPRAGARDLIAIPKAVQPAHVRDNAAALGAQLDADALARLDAAFPAPDRKTPLDIV